jgi:hypothetical protein
MNGKGDDCDNEEIFSPLAEANGNLFRNQFTEPDTQLLLK